MRGSDAGTGDVGVADSCVCVALGADAGADTDAGADAGADTDAGADACVALVAGLVAGLDAGFGGSFGIPLITNSVDSSSHYTCRC